MAGTQTTKQARAADLTTFNHGYYDASGIGSGPFHTTVAAGVGMPPSGITPVSGTFAATGQSAAFTPIAGRMFNASLWGTFVATVRLERSFDSGTTWMPITAGVTTLYSWTAPASEQAQEDESGVIYRLNCTAYTSGTVQYRISQ